MIELVRASNSTARNRFRSRAGVSLSILASALAVVLVSACSSSSTGPGAGNAAAGASSAGTQSGGSSQGIATARADVANFSMRPTQIGITTPLGSVPKGKSITLINCSAPGCSVVTQGIGTLISQMGWQFKTVNVDNTKPEAVQTSIAQEIARKPTAIVMIAIPRSEVGSANLAAAKAANIPLILCSTPDQVGAGISAVVTGANQYSYATSAMADWVVANEQGKGTALFVYSPLVPIFLVDLNAFQTQYEKLCPGCKFATLQIAGPDIGTPAMTTAEVGYLRAHPGVTSVTLAYGGFDAGLRTALKQGGVANAASLPFLGVNAIGANYSDLAASSAGAYTATDLPAQAMRVVYALAAIFKGQSPAAAEQPAPIWMITSGNLSQLPAAGRQGLPFPVVANGNAQFKALVGQ